MIERDREPSPLELKVFGLLFALFFAVLGSLATWRFERPTLGVTLFAVGGIGMAVYYGVPGTKRFLLRLWTAVTYPIGWTISHLVLVLVYYLLFTPLGLLLRLFRRDPMQRRWDAETESYWTERAATPDAKRYFKQY